MKNLPAMLRRILLTLALLLLALELASPPGLAQGDLSVYGVRPGMSSEQVRKALGTPQVQQKDPAVWAYRRERQGVRGQDDPAVHFDPSGRVFFVTGSRLEREGQQILRRGSSLPDMEAALGEPSASQPGQGKTVLYRYASARLTVVVAGNPARVVVFGLGDEPRP
ncbi:MAG: outer membrane protein assembly factor BamE domain-containing protein [Candidatus Xenobium sp.]|jgi:hypothetical protein|nr:outer membrane protein assembly factor BamE [Burkholderiales bacterium]